MKVINFLISRKDTHLRIGGTIQRMDRGTMAVTTSKVSSGRSSEFVLVVCTMSQLFDVCGGFNLDLNAKNIGNVESCTKLVSLSYSAEMSVSELLSGTPEKAITFLILYCLSTDWDYFSTYFTHLINQNGSLLAFFSKHAFNPWPTERYAEMLGVSLRKLNIMFRQSYGVSPKKWLMEKRLERAQYLLECTLFPVADVAEHCGFSNHAYFSDSFKRKFKRSPTQWRENIIFKTLNGDEH
ncbi:AraC family transcriptional regulator [Salmonella enterica subsp. enterica]|nr:AraC family transcriptional regulator [Salmonella enterica subsp. enterica serovar Bonn]EBZ5939309.1 AraC family transcriptional regulator [Salmonella enterica subsp. enterica serovar Muenchen]MLZ41052.1 AraC family transcriptional regulator [Salmonella enterica subsp. enterica serovar Bonn]